MQCIQRINIDSPVSLASRQRLGLSRINGLGSNNQHIIFQRTLISRAAKSVAKDSGVSEKNEETANADSRVGNIQSISGSEETELSPVVPRSMTDHPVVKRLPPSLRRYAGHFLDAPLIYGTSFLILHELTAVVPLFGLWSVFHQLDFVPQGMPEWLLENGNDYVEKIAKHYNWDVSTAQQGSRLMLEGAASYAIVKILLPLRAALSLYWTPGFARLVLQRLLKLTQIFGRKKTGKENSEQKVTEKEDLALDEQLKDLKSQKRDL